MVKVVATNLYAKYNIVDKELGVVPSEDTVFEVSESRYNQLVNNNFGALVKKVEEEQTISSEEKPKKKRKNKE